MQIYPKHELAEKFMKLLRTRNSFLEIIHELTSLSNYPVNIQALVLGANIIKPQLSSFSFNFHEVAQNEVQQDCLRKI